MHPIKPDQKRKILSLRQAFYLCLVLFGGLAVSFGSGLFAPTARADDDKKPPKKVHTGRADVSRGRNANPSSSQPTTQPSGRRVINSGRGRNRPRANVKSPSAGARRRGDPSSQPAQSRQVDIARRRRAAQARRAAASRRRSERLNRRNRNTRNLRFSEVRSEPVQDNVNYGVEDVVEDASGKQYRLRYKFDPQQPLYLVFQNEFIDRGGVPGLMTFKSEARDRTTIKQTMASAQGAPGTPGGEKRFYKVTWEVDRFQIEESAMDKSASFDSLKETYPVRKLRKLGRVPGTRIDFEQNGWTGEFKNVQVRYGNDHTGPATREKVSRTSKRADIEPENLQRLFDDLGTLILPRRPVAIGTHWCRERRTPIRNFGDSVIRYDLSLQNVAQQGADLIATVRIDGELTLEKTEAEPENDQVTGATDHTGDDQQNGSPRGRGPAKPQVKNDAGGKDFNLDRAAVEGEFKFNITQGRLVELYLRRVREMSADMETEAMGKMSLESGEAHTMRLTVSTTEPVKPIIIGGPKPPDEPEEVLPENTRTVGRPTSQQLEKQRKAREEAQKRREERQERAQKSLQERLEAARRARERATSQPSKSDDGDRRELPPRRRPPVTTQPANDES